jgi:RND superfamily putative drug exporter
MANQFKIKINFRTENAKEKIHTDFFYRFGEVIYKYRWLVLTLWLIAFFTCIPYAPKFIESFKAIGFTDPNSQSAKANDILNSKLNFSYNRFIIMYSSDKMLATQPEFSREIKNSLAGLKDFTLPHQIVYPEEANKQISKDKHTAYAVILFKSAQEVDHKSLEEFKTAIKPPPHLIMHIGGEPIFLEDTKIQTQLDLYRAEYIGGPVAIVTMLIVFGSVIAACIPVLIGGICALIILMVLFLAGKVVTLSVFTLNIALLLGLCLSLDYALLIVNRFRDELRRGRGVQAAVAATQATAGKSVFFSGLAVFISLSALLLFPINVLFSVGVGGLAAACVGVSVALTMLPALLGILNQKINLLPIRLFKQGREKGNSFWHWIVTKVVKRPLVYFISLLVVLLFLGYPFIYAKFGFSDFRILPKNLESRQVFDNFKQQFGENKLSPLFVLITTPQKNILTQKNIGHIYDYVQDLKDDVRIDSVISIVSTDPMLTKKQYEMLYTDQRDHLPQGLKDLLKNTTKDNLTVLTILSRYPGGSPVTKQLVDDLRTSIPGDELKVDVTGGPVNSMDALKSISHTFPLSFLWIIGFTYLILLFSLRSVFLPLKAIITATLSLFASYGMLTLVIQKGYFHNQLNFEPQGFLDISLLIIIFCALFGISMDYEVFLLTRIKEYYEQTNDNIKSIVLGIDRSSKIISSAAIIVIVICFSFMSADILIVKAFGLGIAVAVFVDAFIIRIMLVPATMALMGKWCWYLPKWLDWLLPQVSFDPEK